MIHLREVFRILDERMIKERQALTALSDKDFRPDAAMVRLQLLGEIQNDLYRLAEIDPDSITPAKLREPTPPSVPNPGIPEKAS